MWVIHLGIEPIGETVERDSELGASCRSTKLPVVWGEWWSGRLYKGSSLMSQ